MPVHALVMVAPAEVPGLLPPKMNQRNEQMYWREFGRLKSITSKLFDIVDSPCILERNWKQTSAFITR